MTEVEWRRSDRARHVALRIDPCLGRVVLTLPRRGTRRAGLALLATHAVWVAERLAALPPAVVLDDGAMIRLEGRAVRIRLGDPDMGEPRLLGCELLVPGPAERLPAQVVGFLQGQAQTRLAALVAQKASRIGLQPRRVVLKDTRSRWGSCAVDRTLTFSWRLVMAPGFVQDYVVAHEVAHLRHMNHSPQFHALEHGLSRFGERARVWLRRHGAGLLRVGTRIAKPAAPSGGNFTVASSAPR